MRQMPPQASFVTVLAWIFIGLSSIGTLTGILQVIAFFTVVDQAQIGDGLREFFPNMPSALVFLFSNFKWLFLGGLFFSALTLASSIGLLKRLEWARWCFIGLMLLTIAWNMGMAVVQLQVVSFAQQIMQAQGAADTRPMVWALIIICMFFVAAFIALHGWIIKRLLARSVAAEFRRIS
ncbi:hypothetical protein [Xanthomonas medicagonis]|uniref:hypothetical protein n=1 Tax=Xanthomonas medicagonis TaxID=3160841 RepID=UPI003517CDB9